jgi:hypothetical protein
MSFAPKVFATPKAWERIANNPDDKEIQGPLKSAIAKAFKDFNPLLIGRTGMVGDSYRFVLNLLPPSEYNEEPMILIRDWLLEDPDSADEIRKLIQSAIPVELA